MKLRLNAHAQYAYLALCAETKSKKCASDNNSHLVDHSWPFLANFRLTTTKNINWTRASIASFQGSAQLSIASAVPRGFSESRYVVTCSWEKNYGFTPNIDFNPLSTRFNFTEFLPTSMHSESMLLCSTSREKRTSKHGISIVLKLVSIEYHKRDAFLAAV